MKQNRICFLAAAAAVLLGTAACNKVKEKEFDPNDPAIYTVTVQPDGSVFKAEGEELVFNFNAPDYWFVSSPVDWLEFEPESGKPGDVTLRVRAKQNIKGERNALITVNAKKQRGKFSVIQDAWPYYHEWAVYGTIGGGTAAQDLSMEDQGDQLVWKRGRIPYHFGEDFQFRMTGSDAVILGLDSGLTQNPDGTYTGALVKGGQKVAFPIEGFWDVTLDVENWTMSAELVGRYPWTLVGTINGGNWDQDVDMGDMGRQLVWEMTKVPFHKGEEFKFRREKNNAVNLGIDGEFTPVEGAENQFVANLKQDGGNIALPAEGYWTLRLDVEAATLTATLTEEFPRAHEGVIWENDDPAGHGPVAWSSQYRIALDGKDGNNEAIATLPEEVWNKLLTQTCYLVVEATNPQIRITTGWWSQQWGGDDFMPGNERLKDNGDGTFTLKLDLANDPSFVEAIDVQHFLITGDRFTPLGIYPENAWENDGTHGGISWSSVYRFGLEGNDGNKECITTFPETIWNKLKTETFYVDLEATNPQIRVTTGWWSTTWTGDDIYAGNERLKDNGDGTMTLTVNLTGDSIVDLLDVQHFLLTGDRYTPLRIRFQW